MAGTGELRNLLKQTQIQILFNKMKWLDGEITERKTPPLREYLIKEMQIQEVDPDKFVRSIDEDFLIQQTDEWIIEFYKFIHGKREFWRERTNWQPEGLLRLKPIIRLENGTHIIPFSKSGKPQAYRPSSDNNIKKSIKGYFPTIKESIVTNNDANRFLEELGIPEPDAIAGVLEYILPKYRPWNKEWNDENDEEQEITKVNLQDNLRDFKWVIKAIEKSPDNPRKEELISKIKKTEFFYARNISDGQKYYCSSEDNINPEYSIYLGETYTENEDIELFFEGNDNIWLLSDMYKEILEEMYEEISATTNFLKLLDIKNEIFVQYREPRWKGLVIIREEAWNNKRGLDSFDPDCEIEGLKHAIDNITKEKAKIIWELLKKHYKRIYGVIQISTNKQYNGADTEEKFSKMGEILFNSEWLPDNKGTFRKPSELSLSDLNDNFDKNSIEAQYCAEKLKMKKELEDELFDQLPANEKKGHQLIKELYKIMPQEKVNEILEKLIESSTSTESSSENIIEDVKNALKNSTSPVITGNQNIDWTGLNPEEENRIRKEYGEQFTSQLKNFVGENKLKIDKKISIVSGGFNPKEFLFEQYKGHCQICNTCLNLGPNKRPHFNVFRIVKTLKKIEKLWTNMEFNILCLCPNCHALLTHGQNNLSNIIEIALKLSNNDLAPEPVRERNGDFYIVKIEIVGEKRELFYSPTHMNKFAAFLNREGPEQ